MKARNKFPKNKYPFSNELCAFMGKDPEFFDSLKISNRNKFLFLGMISTSFLPSNHLRKDDQIIGFWYADIKNIRKGVKPYFKQDFIVNLYNIGKKFVSYTLNRHVNGGSVLPIKTFFDIYGSNGKFYHKGNRWDHHYDTVHDLPKEPEILKKNGKLVLEKIQEK